MPVTIGELTTTIDTLPGTQAGAGTAAATADEAPFEQRIEDLRAIVRALVAEELERQSRRRSDCP